MIVKDKKHFELYNYLVYNELMKDKKYFIKLIIIVVGILIDLVTKIIFANVFMSGRDDIVIIDNFFYLTYVQNTGAAYGMFSGSAIGLAIFSVLFIIAFVVYDYFNHDNHRTYIGAVSLKISGAIGNLIDRLFLGYVRDFLVIELFSFVFNIADLLVTIGVGLFIINLIVTFVREKKGRGNVKDNK